MSCGSQHPDEDIGRDAQSVAVRYGRHSRSRCACPFRDVCVREPPGLDDLRERDREVRAKFHFGRVGLGQMQCTAEFASCSNGYPLPSFRHCHVVPRLVVDAQWPVLV